MASKIFKTSGQAWKFIQQQPGKHFRWTYEAVPDGWQARPKTDAEYKEGQRIYGDLVKADQDSKPTR